MTATNHVITGAVLAAALPHPIILPVAFMSHYLLDAFPHFGSHPSFAINGRNFSILLLSDMAVAASILLTLVILRLPGWQYMVASGIFAASPDLMWLPRFIRGIQGRSTNVKAKYTLIRWHREVQKMQIPNGWPFEIIWFVLMLFAFAWLSTRLLFR